MTDRDVTVRLRAVTAEYNSAMARAGQSTASFAKAGVTHTGNVARSLQGVSSQATVVGASLLGIGVAAVATFASFDKQMSGVQAVTAATAGEMDKLRAAAIQAGQATQYSASDAAGAEAELAKAGVSTADILGGALSGSLALAAAGQLDVASSASIAATAMTQFGLKGSDVGHIADLLAAGANKAQGSVQDLGTALKYVGPVAHQMGISVDETTGVLAELASNGILADQAGTSLRGMLTALTSPSKIAASTMADLGINVYDTSGNFVGFAGVAAQLQSALGHLTNAQRDAALGQIFGNEQITAARVLYAGGAQAVQDWTAKVNDQGAAARQAAVQMDNLAGDINNLQSSLETTLIQSGSQANGVLRDMVQAATGAINAVGGLPGPVLGAGLAVTTAAGAFLVLAPRVVAAVDAFGKFRAASPRTAGAIAGVGKAAGKAAVLIAGLQAAGAALNHFDTATLNAGLGVNELEKKLLTIAATGKGDVALGFSTSDGAAKSFNEALAQIADNHWWDQLGTDVAGMANFDTTFALSQKAVEGVDSTLAQMVSDGYAVQAAQAFDALRASFVKAGGDGAVFDKQMSGYRDALAGVDVATGKATGATGALAGAVDTATSAADNAKAALDALSGALDTLRGTQISADEATSNVQASIDAATQSLKDNGRTLDLHSEKGRANNAALRDLATTTLDAAKAWAINGDSVKVVTGRSQEARDAFVHTAIQMGYTKTAAQKLADKYGLIPAKIATDVAVYGADKAKAEVDKVLAALHKLHTGVSVAITTTGDVNAHGTAVRPGKAAGGWITGPGTTTSDSVLTPTSRGEFVLQAAAAQAQPRAAEAFNAGNYSQAAAYLGGAPTTTFSVGQITAVAAPGERAAESIPRALRNKVFELTGAGS